MGTSIEEQRARKAPPATTWIEAALSVEDAIKALSPEAKTARKEVFDKAWRRKNSERKKANGRAWYLKNQEKVKARTKAWCLKNQEYVKAYQKIYAETPQGQAAHRQRGCQASSLVRFGHDPCKGEPGRVLQDCKNCRLCQERREDRASDFRTTSVNDVVHRSRTR
jgi:hypothetical protein